MRRFWKQAEKPHIRLFHSQEKTDQVSGFVFEISPDDLMRADSYEVSDYKRINVQLNSGINAWVYVNAAETIDD